MKYDFENPLLSLFTELKKPHEDIVDANKRKFQEDPVLEWKKTETHFQVAYLCLALDDIDALRRHSSCVQNGLKKSSEFFSSQATKVVDEAVKKGLSNNTKKVKRPLKASNSKRLRNIANGSSSGSGTCIHQYFLSMFKTNVQLDYEEWITRSFNVWNITWSSVSDF